MLEDHRSGVAAVDGGAEGLPQRKHAGSGDQRPPVLCRGDVLDLQFRQIRAQCREGVGDGFAAAPGVQDVPDRARPTAAAFQQRGDPASREVRVMGFDGDAHSAAVGGLDRRRQPLCGGRKVGVPGEQPQCRRPQIGGQPQMCRQRFRQIRIGQFHVGGQGCEAHAGVGELLSYSDTLCGGQGDVHRFLGTDPKLHPLSRMLAGQHEYVFQGQTWAAEGGESRNGHVRSLGPSGPSIGLAPVRWADAGG